MKYRVRITQDEDGALVAEVPALPGCVSQGETRSDAIKNMQEAIEAYLESLKMHGESVPRQSTRKLLRWTLERPNKNLWGRGHSSINQDWDSARQCGEKVTASSALHHLHALQKPLPIRHSGCEPC